jgi:NCAIR mutase (PurE)-related protein
LKKKVLTKCHSEVSEIVDAVQALTKQNGVRLFGKLKEELKKKLKPTYPT